MWKLLLLLVVFLVVQDADGFFFWRKGPRQKQRTIHVCEHRRQRLECGRGLEIRVRYAMYGRLSRSVCSRNFRGYMSTKCTSRHSARITKRLCNGKRVCHLHASNSVYGDPCVGTFKYLKVVYSCKKRRIHFVRRKDFVRRKGLVGCHVDGRYRTLGGAFKRSKYMTINKCLNICKRRRNTYAGVEYGRECFCGNAIRRKKKVALSQCKMPCSGYKKEGCGGTWRVAIYRTGVKKGKHVHVHVIRKMLRRRRTWVKLRCGRHKVITVRSVKYIRPSYRRVKYTWGKRRNYRRRRGISRRRRMHRRRRYRRRRGMFRRRRYRRRRGSYRSRHRRNWRRKNLSVKRKLNATRRAKAFCNGKRRCTLVSSSRFIRRKFKYISVKYSCKSPRRYFKRSTRDASTIEKDDLRETPKN